MLEEFENLNRIGSEGASVRKAAAGAEIVFQPSGRVWWPVFRDFRDPTELRVTVSEISPNLKARVVLKDLRTWEEREIGKLTQAG